MKDITEQAKEEVLIHHMPRLMKAWKQWKTVSKLVELVNKTISQQDEVTHFNFKCVCVRAHVLKYISLNIFSRLW